MLILKPSCECCNRDLPADSRDAHSTRRGASTISGKQGPRFRAAGVRDLMP